MCVHFLYCSIVCFSVDGKSGDRVLAYGEPFSLVTTPATGGSVSTGSLYIHIYIYILCLIDSLVFSTVQFILEIFNYGKVTIQIINEGVQFINV